MALLLLPSSVRCTISLWGRRGEGKEDEQDNPLEMKKPEKDINQRNFCRKKREKRKCWYHLAPARDFPTDGVEPPSSLHQELPPPPSPTTGGRVEFLSLFSSSFPWSSSIRWSLLSLFRRLKNKKREAILVEQKRRKHSGSTLYLLSRREGIMTEVGEKRGAILWGGSCTTSFAEKEEGRTLCGVHGFEELRKKN